MANPDNRQNVDESKISSQKGGRVSKFVEKAKGIGRKMVIVPELASLLSGGLATKVTTFIPEIAPAIMAMAKPTIVTGATVALGSALTGCKGPDIISPNIDLKESKVDITGGKQVLIKGNEVRIGNILVATISDDTTSQCKITLSMNGKGISSGTIISEPGTLVIQALDDAGNPKSVKVQLVVRENKAPEIHLNKEEVDVTGGKEISIVGNQLKIGDETIASWTDDNTKNCNVSLRFNDQEIQSGIIIKEKGILTLIVTDEDGKYMFVDITLNFSNSAPDVILHQESVDVTGGKQVSVVGNQLMIGSESVMSWTDDNTADCDVSLKLNGNDIEIGSVINEKGTLTVRVTDEHGEFKEVVIELTVINKAPEVTVHKSEVDVTGGKQVSVVGNQLMIGSESVVSWTDDNTADCDVSLKVNGKAIEIGSVVNEKGILIVRVADEDGEYKEVKIELTVINKAPEVTVHKSEVDVTGGKQVSVVGNQLKIGNEIVASWTDDNTQNCNVSMTLNGKTVNSGGILKEKGVLTVVVADGEGKFSTFEITLGFNNGAPEISLIKGEVDVTGGKKVSINGNQLKIGGEVIATWTDDNTANCSTTLKYNNEEIESGSTINKKGTLTLIVIDEEGKTSSINIILTVVNNAPDISLLKEEVDVTGGKKVSINGNQLKIGGEVVATWTDDNTANCSTTLKYNNEEIESGSTINNKGTLTLIVIDEEGKISSINIILTVVNNAPDISLLKGEVDVTGGKKVLINGNQLKIGNEVVATWKDDNTTNCNTILKYNDNEIESGSTINKKGTLTLIVIDEEGKISSINIILTVVNNAPEISLIKGEVDVTGGKKVSINGNQLKIGNEVVATWKDDNTINCSASLKFNDQTIESGSTLSDEGTLILMVADEEDKVSSESIKLTVVKNNAPEITREYPANQTPNVIGKVVVTMENNNLLFGNVVIYSGKDQETSICTPSLEIDGNPVQSGATIDLSRGNHTCKYTLTDEGGKKTSENFGVVCEGATISGLNNLNLGEEINRSEKITLPQGATHITKIVVEMDDGSYQEIVDVNQAFTPALPGSGRVTVHYETEFGGKVEDTGSINVASVGYEAPNLKTVDFINEKYSRYNNLNQVTKDFVYPHLAISFEACNGSKQNNVVHFILGEGTTAVENIGGLSSDDNHAYEGYYRDRAVCPDVTIKCCYCRDYLMVMDEYIKQHPNERIFITVACGPVWNNRNDYNSDSTVNQYRNILKNYNAVMVGGVEDKSKGEGLTKIYDESIKDGDCYTRVSPNSKIGKNMISVVGWYPGFTENFFSNSGGFGCRMPVGFDKDNGNVLMYMTSLITTSGRPDLTTTSSYATSVLRGFISNISCAIWSNNPDKNVVEVMDIIDQNYLVEDVYKYEDEVTGEKKNGGKRYGLDGRKVIRNEMWKLDELDKIQFRATSNDIPLPNRKSTGWEGRGVYFKVGGIKYPSIKANQSILEQAMMSGNIEEWGRSYTLFRQQGGQGDSVDIGVFSVDDKARVFIKSDSPIKKHIDLSEANYSISSIKYTKNIHLAADRNMVADIPSEIAPQQKFLLGDHIKIDGPLKSYAEVYQKSKGRIPYEDAEKSLDILDLQVRLNSSLVADNSTATDNRMNGRILLLNNKGETIKAQNVDSLVIDPNIQIAQALSEDTVDKSYNTHQSKTTPGNKSYQSSIHGTPGAKQKFDKGIAYVKNNNIPRRPQTPRTQNKGVA